MKYDRKSLAFAVSLVRARVRNHDCVRAEEAVRLFKRMGGSSRVAERLQRSIHTCRVKNWRTSH